MPTQTWLESELPGPRLNLKQIGAQTLVRSSCSSATSVTSTAVRYLGARFGDVRSAEKEGVCGIQG